MLRETAENLKFIYSPTLSRRSPKCLYKIYDGFSYVRILVFIIYIFFSSP
jgi:hypothetical protein